MNEEGINFGTLDFYELEGRFGLESARVILRTLEQFEGISENCVAKLSYNDRFNNVMSAMRENINYQTKH